MSITAAVTVYVTITDPETLIAAGRKWLIEHGVAGDMDTAAEIIATDDYSMALRYLIDPGVMPDWGIEVEDTTCEVEST